MKSNIAISFSSGKLLNYAGVAMPLVVAVCAVGALGGLPSSVKIGSISLLALLTSAIFSVASLIIILRLSLFKGLVLHCLLFGLYLSWCMISVLWHSPSFATINSIIVQLGFFSLLILTAQATVLNQAVVRSVRVGLRLATSLVFLGFVLSAVSRGSLVHNVATIPLASLWIMAYYVARWCSGSWRSVWVVAALLVLSFLSLARAPFGIGLILVLIGGAIYKGKIRMTRIVAGVVVSVCIVVVALVYIESFGSAFFGGDNAVQLAGFAINTSGRITLWTYTFQSFLESPWFGKGLGSSTDALREVSHLVSSQEHPHNDYLRIMHDLGLLGMGLWLIAFGALFSVLFKAWRRVRFDSSKIFESEMHLTAVLALLVTALSMVTDNTIAYSFFMYPVAVLAGASLGLNVKDGGRK